MKTYCNTLPSSHFLFIKCARCYSDKDFLAMLGTPAIRYLNSWPESSWLRSDGKICESMHALEHAACISDDGQWLQVVDSLYFDLFFNRKVARGIKKLTADYELYHCLAGDTDDYVELKHWKDGRRVRHLAGNVRSFSFSKNVGSPFQCESQYSSREARKLDWQGRSFILSIAEEIGINVDHTQGTVRAYEIAPSKPID